MGSNRSVIRNSTLMVHKRYAGESYGQPLVVKSLTMTSSLPIPKVLLPPSSSSEEQREEMKKRRSSLASVEFLTTEFRRASLEIESNGSSENDERICKLRARRSSVIMTGMIDE